MIILLPEKKLSKARTMIENIRKRRSTSLLDIEKNTGYLNLLSTVVPLGQTFLWQLYNMERYLPSGGRHTRGRLSGEANKDLTWWAEVLS